MIAEGSRNFNAEYNPYNPNYIKVKLPGEFLAVPPVTDYLLTLRLNNPSEYIKTKDSYNKKVKSGKIWYETTPYNNTWGKISFLPIIETNQTFTTIKSLYLVTTPDVLRRLEGFGIATNK